MVAPNTVHDNAVQPGLALAHTIHGEPAISQFSESIGEGVARATWSTAPYVPPKRRAKDNPNRALCSEDGCKAFPSGGTPYCTGHARKHGLMPSCARRECGAAPQTGSKYCYHHRPAEPAVEEADTVTEADLYGDAD